MARVKGHKFIGRGLCFYCTKWKGLGGCLILSKFNLHIKRKFPKEWNYSNNKPVCSEYNEE